MIDSVGTLNSMFGRTDPAAFNRPQGNPFNRADKNGDGVLDKSEAQTVMASFSNVTGKSDNLDKIFSTLDSNGDGLIDQREFRAGNETLRQMAAEQQLTAMMGAQQEEDFLPDAFRDFTGKLTDQQNPENSQAGEISWAFNNPMIASYVNNAVLPTGRVNGIELLA